MSEEVKRITACRLCGGEVLSPVVDLGQMYISDFPRRTVAKHPPVGMSVVQCERCELVQLEYTAPRDWMYRDYYYRSGLNESMVKALQDVVDSAGKYVHLDSKKDTAIDIGANDGTLLGMLENRVANRIAFEPALNLGKELAQHCNIMVPDFFPPQALYTGPKAKLITSIAMFYDLEDPVMFVREIARNLAADGLWVVQFTDLRAMVEVNAWDSFCLPGESPIITPQGLRKIQDIKIGDTVLTHKGNTKKVEKTFCREYHGELVEITAYGMGYTLLVTPEHPVMMKYSDEQPWQFVQAKDIDVGDIIGRPVPKVEAPTYIDFSVGHGRWEAWDVKIPTSNLLTLFGYYLSEGSAQETTVSFHFGPKEMNLAEDCRNRIIKLGFKASIHKLRTSITVTSGGPLSRVMRRECGIGAGGKKLPFWAFGLETSQAEELLRAYMAGDGYVYRENYLRATTVSEQLALDIQMLAAKIGWKTSINLQKRPATCVIEGRIVNQLPLWDILVHTKQEKKMKTWITDGYQCSKVRKVEYSGFAGKVYNIQVEDDNTYVSPAMAVHNCHEHLCYYSTRTFMKVLELADTDLQVVDVERNTVNGGSVRYYLQHERHVEDSFTVASADNAFARLQAEFSPTQEITKARLKEFVAEIQTCRNKVCDYLAEEVEAGVAKGKIVNIDVLGASTKGNTLLQFFGLDSRFIRRAIDRNKDKEGRFTVGTWIPIVGEDEGSVYPAAILLALPWHFKEGLVKREEKFLSLGGKILFPMPKPVVVSKEGEHFL